MLWFDTIATIENIVISRLQNRMSQNEVARTKHFKPTTISRILCDNAILQVS